MEGGREGGKERWRMKSRDGEGCKWDGCSIRYGNDCGGMAVDEREVGCRGRREREGRKGVERVNK